MSVAFHVGTDRMGMTREPSRSTIPGPSFLSHKTAQEKPKGLGGHEGDRVWPVLEQISTPTEMPVGLLGALGEAGQRRRGFVHVSARNLCYLLLSVIAGAYQGFPLDAFTSAPAAALWAGVGCL